MDDSNGWNDWAMLWGITSRKGNNQNQKKKKKVKKLSMKEHLKNLLKDYQKLVIIQLVNKIFINQY